MRHRLASLCASASRSTWRLAVWALLAFGAASSVTAETVGTAIVNGRPVLLDSNGTWTYKDAAAGPSQCDRVENVDVCLRAIGWERGQPSGAMRAVYNRGQKYYFGLIVEPTGSKDGFTNEFMRTAILTNAGRAAGVGPADVPVLDVGADAGGIKDLNSLDYLAKISNTTFVFRNFYKIYPDRTVQLVFWAIGDRVTDEFRKDSETALTRIKSE
jgi:hypothetical protein